MAISKDIVKVVVVEPAKDIIKEGGKIWASAVYNGVLIGIAYVGITTGISLAKSVMSAVGKGVDKAFSAVKGMTQKPETQPEPETNPEETAQVEEPEKNE